MKKLTPKKINLYFVIAFVVGALVAYTGVFSEAKALVAVGMIVMLGSIALRVVFYRCPHCGAYLDRSTGEFCPHCGEKVNE